MNLVSPAASSVLDEVDLVSLQLATYKTGPCFASYQWPEVSLERGPDVSFICIGKHMIS